MFIFSDTMASSSMDKTTLVIDDTSTSRQIAIMIAKKLGFNTFGATNGQEAVDLNKSG